MELICFIRQRQRFFPSLFRSNTKIGYNVVILKGYISVFCDYQFVSFNLPSGPSQIGIPLINIEQHLISCSIFYFHMMVFCDRNSKVGIRSGYTNKILICNHLEELILLYRHCSTRINYSSGWNDINLIAFMGILLIFAGNKHHRTLNNDEFSH